MHHVGEPIMQQWWPPLCVDALVIDERWRAAATLTRSSPAAEVNVNIALSGEERGEEPG